MSSQSDELAAELRNVTVEIGQRRILDDVSLSIDRAALTAIVGPNGCGKSTIARILTGFLYPTSGSATILGRRLGETNVHSLRERVKLVQPTQPYEPDARMTVRDVVLTGVFGTTDLHDVPSSYDEARTDILLRQLAIAHVQRSSFRTCSTGERMRTQLARALMTRPGLLILDEPTAGLDLPTRERLLATLDALLAERDAPAILLVTHHVEELPPSTRSVVLMSPGRVLRAGGPAAVLTSALMSETFGYPIDVQPREGRFIAHASRSARLDA